MVIIIIIILLIMLGFIGSHPLTIFPIIGAGILYYKYSKKYKDLGNKLDKKDYIMLIIWSCVLWIMFIITIVLGTDSSSGGYNSPSDSELNSCRAQSNTYYRCHWATLENRCVCSRR